MLRVSDTGIGMSAETCSHIFEPFFTTKPTGQGHRARPGHGVRDREAERRRTSRPYPSRAAGPHFRSPFRWRTGPPRPRRSPAARSGAPGNGTILLVEDEAAVRRLAVRALRDRGYEVLEAENGEQALQLVEPPQARRLTLLVSDVVMPGLSGPELAARLRLTLPDLKVIYMSGYAPEELAASVTADYFLPKPFTPDGLGALVAQVLGAGARPGEVAGPA